MKEKNKSNMLELMEKEARPFEANEFEFWRFSQKGLIFHGFGALAVFSRVIQQVQVGGVNRQISKDDLVLLGSLGAGEAFKKGDIANGATKIGIFQGLGIALKLLWNRCVPQPYEAFPVILGSIRFFFGGVGFIASVLTIPLRSLHRYALQGLRETLGAKKIPFNFLDRYGNSLEETKNLLGKGAVVWFGVLSFFSVVFTPIKMLLDGISNTSAYIGNIICSLFSLPSVMWRSILSGNGRDLGVYTKRILVNLMKVLPVIVLITMLVLNPGFIMAMPVIFTVVFVLAMLFNSVWVMMVERADQAFVLSANRKGWFKDLPEDEAVELTEMKAKKADEKAKLVANQKDMRASSMSQSSKSDEKASLMPNQEDRLTSSMSQSSKSDEKASLVANQEDMRTSSMSQSNKSDEKASLVANQDDRLTSSVSSEVMGPDPHSMGEAALISALNGNEHVLKEHGIQIPVRDEKSRLHEELAATLEARKSRLSANAENLTAQKSQIHGEDSQVHPEIGGLFDHHQHHEYGIKPNDVKASNGEGEGEGEGEGRSESGDDHEESHLHH
jgi:hypothetical protein